MTFLVPVSEVVCNLLCLIHIKTFKSSIVRAVFNSNSHKKGLELFDAINQ